MLFKCFSNLDSHHLTLILKAGRICSSFSMIIIPQLPSESGRYSLLLNSSGIVWKNMLNVLEVVRLDHQLFKIYAIVQT